MIHSPLIEQIAQLLMVGFDGTKLQKPSLLYQYLTEDKVGGVILFDYSFETQSFGHKNIDSPTQLKQLNTDILNLCRDLNLAKPFIGIDCEGGTVNRLRPAYGFENLFHAAEILGQMGEDATFSQSERMAMMLKACHINVNFAPVVDVNTNANCPIIGKLGRSYSKEPQAVWTHARAFVKAHSQQGVMTCFKHFPGHGSADGDTHKGIVDVSNTWSDIELWPYQQMMASEIIPAFVMTSHVINRTLDDSGVPASLSYVMTTSILRERLGYEGIIITDDLSMKALSDNKTPSEIAVQALKAGADMLIFSGQLAAFSLKEVLKAIQAAVEVGDIPMEHIVQANQRIAKVKAIYL